MMKIKECQAVLAYLLDPIVPNTLQPAHLPRDLKPALQTVLDFLSALSHLTAQYSSLPPTTLLQLCCQKNLIFNCKL
jgi:hypothetical protein